MSGFFALLDDIAALAKMTLSTLDDTAAMAVKTSAKVSAAAVDDVAATPQYVTGITPDREIPIIKRIALASLRNKLVLILPVGLLLSWLAPALLPVALIVGGTYLCFEGGEKILATLLGHDHAGDAAEAADEDTIVRRATTTDLVLSTEIMLLALAEVQNETPTHRIVILVIIALLITFGVYGLVAALIKLDDLGVHMVQRGRTGAARATGHRIVASAPAVFGVIGIIGTVAMLWVGGQILAHNLAGFGLTAPHHLIEHAAELVDQPVVSWVLGTGAAFIFGLIVGATLAGMVMVFKRLAR